MMEELLKEARDRMQKAFEHLKKEVKKMRTGRADVSLLEGIKVSCYGGERELKHIASVSCPDARSLSISPWDQNLLKDIEAAMIKSETGLAPVRKDRVIRLQVPELTEERRRDIIKIFKKDVEKSRVEIRQIRQIINEKIKKSLNEKQISEDECELKKKEIQNLTDTFIEKINELSGNKQKELMQV